MSVCRSQDFYIGSHLPTRFACLAHPKGLPGPPLLDVLIPHTAGSTAGTLISENSVQAAIRLDNGLRRSGTLTTFLPEPGNETS